MTNLSISAPKTVAPGTQVVIRVSVADSAGRIAHPAGAVGVVVKVLPDEAYQVRFLDGYEATLSRSELAIRKHVQRAGLQAAVDEATAICAE